MQILKDEIRKRIIEIAEQEFLKRGFKEASMRTIAKKAQTTQGNLYNYFSSKEALLDAVVGDLPSIIESIFKEHEEPIAPLNEVASWEEEAVMAAFNQIGFEKLLSKPFIILMEGCKGTKYEFYRKSFIELGKFHMLKHLQDPKKEKLAGMVAVSFLEAVLFIGKTQNNFEEGRQAFLEYFRILILGIMKQE